MVLHILAFWVLCGVPWCEFWVVSLLGVSGLLLLGLWWAIWFGDLCCLGAWVLLVCCFGVSC